MVCLKKKKNKQTLKSRMKMVTSGCLTDLVYEEAWPNGLFFKSAGSFYQTGI